MKTRPLILVSITTLLAATVVGIAVSRQLGKSNCQAAGCEAPSEPLTEDAGIRAQSVVWLVVLSKGSTQVKTCT